MNTYEVTLKANITEKMTITAANDHRTAVEIAKSSLEAQFVDIASVEVVSATAYLVLDYDKPIVAIDEVKGFVYLLINNGDELGGTYDWYNITTARFNSNVGWTTKEEAVANYKDRYFVQNSLSGVSESGEKVK